MSVSNIRTKLADALSAITSLKGVYTKWPVPIPGQFPCVIIWPNTGTPDVNLPRTMQTLRWKVELLTLRGGKIEDAQGIIDGYLDLAGSNSIKAVIETYDDYPPDCNFARLVGWSNYGEKKIDDISYFGVTFDIETK